ncbi:tripartite tricarboxylate transporter permease [Dysosmobacter sp.]|uniref:tripartite tricarboxylate transporter permease n=1 Tax=Dysosmobacter sp. TaxID=2591382 RepID=UPI003AB4FB23
MEEIFSALSKACTIEGFLVVAGGVLLGILMGALPGISVNMAITLLFPFAYAVEGVNGINMLLGVMCGAIYGGSISAILLNTPGTPGSAATMIDGYPLTKNGQPGRALGMSTFASGFGGIFSCICLIFFSPLLAKLALKFSSLEYCAFAFFGISIISSLSSDSIIKGLIGGVIGLLLTCIGVDPINGVARYSFGSMYLMGGIAFLPLLIGLLAFSRVLINIEEAFKKKRENIKSVMNFDPRQKMKIFPSFSDIKRCMPTILGSSLLGTAIGCVPGTGGDIACFIAYNEAKRFNRRHREEFGHGAIEGVAAPEAANNGVSGGAMIPMLSLGIPGDGATAILLGALMIKGITPGPTLFSTEMEKVYQIFVGMGLANIFMVIIGFLILRWTIKVINIPDRFLLPLIVALCFIGTYSYGHTYIDLIVMAIGGVIGYFAIKHDFTMSSVIIGFILGSMTESNFRRYLLINRGDFMSIFDRPIAVAFFALSIITIFWPIINKLRDEIKKSK